MEVKKFTSSFLDNCAYAIINHNKALVIDTVCDSSLLNYLEELNVDEIIIILTHEHCDHLLGIEALKSKFKTTIICQEEAARAIKDSRKNLSAYFSFIVAAYEDKGQNSGWASSIDPFVCEADISFSNDYVLGFEGYRFILHSTPGHSKGSLCVLMYNGRQILEAIFTGDSLMKDYPTHTNLPQGSLKKYNDITRPFLLGMPENIIVYPGHGRSCYFKDCLNMLDNINGKVVIS